MARSLLETQWPGCLEDEMIKCNVGHVREFGETCSNEAVIRIGGLNLCAEHADPNVLDMQSFMTTTFFQKGPLNKAQREMLGKCVVALEPK